MILSQQNNWGRRAVVFLYPWLPNWYRGQLSFKPLVCCAWMLNVARLVELANWELNLGFNFSMTFQSCFLARLHSDEFQNTQKKRTKPKKEGEAGEVNIWERENAARSWSSSSWWRLLLCAYTCRRVWRNLWARLVLAWLLHPSTKVIWIRRERLTTVGSKSPWMNSHENWTFLKKCFQILLVVSLCTRGFCLDFICLVGCSPKTNRKDKQGDKNHDKHLTFQYLSSLSQSLALLLWI